MGLFRTSSSSSRSTPSASSSSPSSELPSTASSERHQRPGSITERLRKASSNSIKGLRKSASNASIAYQPDSLDPSIQDSPEATNKLKRRTSSTFKGMLPGSKDKERRRASVAGGEADPTDSPAASRRTLKPSFSFSSLRGKKSGKREKDK